ncbi:MAG: hypothetical protein RL065_1876 [Bacteroidota bacterium]|jgi:hypothetical protein
MNSVLIYIPNITNRAKYTFDILLKNLLGLQIKITSSVDDFTNYNEAKFSYGVAPISNELYFESTELLFEQNIDNTFFKNKTINEAFKIKKNTAFGIDIFAASFYLLSRYEEYNNCNFDFKDSILHQSKLLQQPVINQWSIELKMLLQFHFPDLQFQQNEYKIIPTFDIDRVFAFKARSITKSIAGTMKDVIKFHFLEVKKRISVLLKNSPDPFDSFDFIETCNKNIGLKTIYFLHCGNYDGVDKNVNFTNSAFKEVVQKISSSNIIGIHPSVKSISHSKLIKSELSLLQSNVQSQKIISSRQHFIKIKFPDSYHILMQNGITEDYTMGYANECGFRAGISNSYNWYDLSNETITNFIIHPFCIMESTYQYYKKNDSNAFLKDASMLSNSVKNVAGNFCFVWHNQSLSEMYEYKGWRKIYNHFLTSII